AEVQACRSRRPPTVSKGNEYHAWPLLVWAKSPMPKEPKLAAILRSKTIKQSNIYWNYKLADITFLSIVFRYRSMRQLY
ncbi:MAG: hypothetical protein WBF12_15005, partial [Bradyrhizobium sp.]